MRIPVHYTPKMATDATSSFSPSAGKPSAVVKEWLALGLPIDIIDVAPATVDQLCAAHATSYVKGVLSTLRINGFGDRSPEVAATLPYTSGSFLAAAKDALSNGIGAVSPTSGFHHAGYNHGGGFCTFNGLMVAAVELLKAKGVSCVGILDFDQHWGDGTHDIIDLLGLETKVYHHYAGHRQAKDAQGWLDCLPTIMERFKDCDVVLYQAGADPHVNDPLGGWMTTKQMALRDKLVFKALKEMGVPVAWNLAGGYQRDKSGGITPVLKIHTNTMLAFAEVWGVK